MRAAAASALGLAALGCLASLVAACGGYDPADPSGESGFTVDSSLVLDDYPFSSAACAEVLPAAFENSDSIPADAVARIVVTATACYSVTIAVEDSLGKRVRTMARFFDLPGRQDGDKDRGAVGYLPWDGRDQAGSKVPAGAYLWRLEFRFGEGRVLKFRADIRLE